MMEKILEVGSATLIANLKARTGKALMIQNSHDDADLNELFYVLGLAFIQIRATDNLETAQIVADIFHNVPAKISRGFEPKSIRKEIDQKASIHGYESRITKMFDTAKKNTG